MSVTDERRQTDRQTDRQTTDGLATAYSEREREFMFAKNEYNVDNIKKL